MGNGNLNRIKVLFILITIFFMLFTSVAPSVSAIGSTDQQHTKVKISERVIEEFQEQEKVTFLVKFKEHANTEEAIRIAEESAAKQSLSSHQLKETKASAVVTA